MCQCVNLEQLIAYTEVGDHVELIAGMWECVNVGMRECGNVGMRK